MINVPSIWSLKQLCNCLQSLYGASLVFTLGGQQLKELQGRLCDGNLTPYSLVSYESIKLQGGMKTSGQTAPKVGTEDGVN